MTVQAPADCPSWNLKCKAAEKVTEGVSDAASSVAGNALEKAATEVKEAVGEAVASVGTVWVRVKSPTLSGDDADGAPAVQAGDTAGPVAEAGVLTFLQFASYISLGVCVLALIVVGARMAIETRRNDAELHVTRVMTVLIAAILISAAAAIATAVMPESSSGGSTVAFLENSLWYYTAAAVVMSVIIGGLRMAWEQRADPGKELVRSLLTFILISGAGVTVIGMLLKAGDAYAVWVLDKSLDCSVDANTKCFGENMMVLLGLSGASGIGVIAVIILGLCAFIGSLVQLGMMIARSGMLIVMAGTLPLAAAASNTVMGKQMLQKFVGWIIALLLYKPAAAIIYAAAFQLAGSDVIGGGLDALGKVVTGLFMMFLALFLLPALMRLVVPAVGAVAAGNAAGNMAMAAAAAVPTGAIAGGQLAGGGSRVAEMGASGAGSSGGPSGSGPDSGSGGSGPDSRSGGSGSSGGGGSSSSSGQGQAPSGAAEGGSGGGTASGDGSGAGKAGGSDAAGGAEAGGAQAASSGAGAGASGAGAGAAAGGGAAAAAAGPAGLAAGAATSSGSSGEGPGGATIGSAASGAVQSAASAASEMGQDAAGESDDTGEGGPSGSR